MPFLIPSDRKDALITKGQFLITKVDHGTIDSLVSWIISNRPEKKEFVVLINSSGGSPSAIVYFASFLATLDPEVKIKGVAFGECGSAALALLQCCHERTAVKHCGFFIHHVNDTFTGSCQGFDFKKVRAELEQSRKLEDELVRLQAKRCKMTKKAWMKLAGEGERQSGKAIFPDKALQLGIVDSIVESYPIF